MQYTSIRARAHCLLAAAGFAAVAFGPGALGAPIEWINASGGTFTNGVNWMGGVVPGPADRAIFALGGSIVVDFGASVVNDRLQIRQGNVFFLLNGRTYQLTSTGLTSVQVGFLSGDNAFLDINGGTLAAQESTIGAFSGASGEVQVTGLLGRFENAGSLIVGDSGEATLSIQGGGIVTFGPRCYVGLQGGAEANVLITGTGSRLTSAGRLDIGPGQIVGGIAAEGAARGGALPTQGIVTVQNSGRIEVGSVGVGEAGVLTGNGVVQAGTLSNVGVVRPGVGVGTLRIEGAYTQSAPGVLEVQIGGTTPGTEHDVLQITGAASLGGTLSVSLSGGFAPQMGQTFVILTASTVTGQFQTLQLPALPGGGQFSPLYSPAGGTVTLTVVAGGNPADLNGDGMVNAQDLGILLGAWGTNNEASDLNNDGTVNASDLALLLTSWG